MLISTNNHAAKLQQSESRVAAPYAPLPKQYWTAATQSHEKRDYGQKRYERREGQRGYRHVERPLQVVPPVIRAMIRTTSA